MKILLISDTHGSLAYAQRIVRKEQADVVLHMGDIGFDPQLPGQVYYVKGNHDSGLQEPKERILSLENRTIYMLHGDIYEREAAENLKKKKQFNWLNLELYTEEFIHVLYDAGKRKGADIVCFGHTHQPIIKQFHDLLLINPGSLAMPFNHTDVSYVVLYLEGDQMHAQIKYYPYEEK